MNVLRYLILFVGLSILTSCMSTSKFNYKVTDYKHNIEVLYDDVDFIFNELKQKHPGVYWYISESELDGKIDSLKRAITEPLTTREFYLKASPVVNSINCGHTRLILTGPRKIKGSNVTPSESIIKKNRYFIHNNSLFFKSANREFKDVKSGLEITAIDNRNIRSILDSLISYIPSDGFNSTFQYAVLNRNFSSWYEHIFKVSDSVKFNVREGDTTINLILKKNIVTAAAKESARSKVSKEKKSKIIKTKKVKYRGLDENNKPILSYEIIDSVNRIAHLKVKSFSFHGSNFSRFYKESFHSLKKDSINHLILDLRDNGGGSLKASRDLFSFLTDKPFIFLDTVEAKGRFMEGNNFLNKLRYPFNWMNNLLFIHKKDNKYLVKVKGTKELKPKSNAYLGDMYVLLNGLSFSASTLLSANLKGIERATFVGNESGGGQNMCSAGRIPIVKVPNTLLKLRYGLYKIAPVIKSKNFGRGIIPDIYVSRSPDDIITNRDVEIETIVNKIKNSR